MLGVRPALGRTFTAAEERQGAKVVGILPTSYNFSTRRANFFVPANLNLTRAGRTSCKSLRGCAPVEQAQAQMSAIARRLAQSYPETNRDIGAVVVPLREQLAGEVRTALLILLAAGAERSRELAVRAALGAGGTRLVRQMFTESMLLAAIAGALGMAVGYAGTRVLAALAPPSFPGSARTLDARVLAFTMLMTALTAAHFELLPAVRVARVALNDGLKQGARGEVGVAAGYCAMRWWLAISASTTTGC